MPLRSLCFFARFASSLVLPLRWLFLFRFSGLIGPFLQGTHGDACDVASVKDMLRGQPIGIEACYAACACEVESALVRDQLLGIADTGEADACELMYAERRLIYLKDKEC